MRDDSCLQREQSCEKRVDRGGWDRDVGDPGLSALQALRGDRSDEQKRQLLAFLQSL